MDRYSFLQMPTTTCRRNLRDLRCLHLIYKTEAMVQSSQLPPAFTLVSDREFKSYLFAVADYWWINGMVRVFSFWLFLDSPPNCLSGCYSAKTRYNGDNCFFDMPGGLGRGGFPFPIVSPRKPFYLRGSFSSEVWSKLLLEKLLKPFWV